MKLAALPHASSISISAATRRSRRPRQQLARSRSLMRSESRQRAAGGSERAIPASKRGRQRAHAPMPGRLLMMSEPCFSSLMIESDSIDLPGGEQHYLDAYAWACRHWCRQASRCRPSQERRTVQQHLGRCEIDHAPLHARARLILPPVRAHARGHVWRRPVLTATLALLLLLDLPAEPPTYTQQRIQTIWGERETAQVTHMPECVRPRLMRSAGAHARTCSALGRD